MSVDQTVVYGPKHGRRIWLGIGMVVLAGLSTATAWHNPAQHAGPSGRPPPSALAIDLSAGFCLLLGLMFLLPIVMRVPRLTMTRHGLVLRTWRHTKSVAWAQLSAF